MGYALSIKNVYTMNVEFYTGIDERLDVPRILPPAPDFVDLSDGKILIVDDVADTGNTLKSVEEFCDGKVGEVRTAVIYEKSPFGREVRLRVEAHRPCGSTSRGRTSRRSPPATATSPRPDDRVSRPVTAACAAPSRCFNAFGGMTPASLPSCHTVTTGRSGLSRGSTDDRSSSGPDLSGLAERHHQRSAS